MKFLSVISECLNNSWVLLPIDLASHKAALFPTSSYTDIHLFCNLALTHSTEIAASILTRPIFTQTFQALHLPSLLTSRQKLKRRLSVQRVSRLEIQTLLLCLLNHFLGLVDSLDPRHKRQRLRRFLVLASMGVSETVKEAIWVFLLRLVACNHHAV